MSNPLEVVTKEQVADGQRSRPVGWYRTPLDPALLRRLHERSDWLGGLQTFTYLGLLVVTGAAAFYSVRHWPVTATIGIVFLYGMITAFTCNAVHELCHNTVFQTQALNALFVRVFAFLGWHNFEAFEASHARHHRYTLHPPDDLEVVLPAKIVWKDFLMFGFVNVIGPYVTVKESIRLARGKFRGPWERTLFPPGDVVKGRPIVNWARTLLVGHGLVLAVAIYFHWWLLPVLVTLGRFYGGWLFFLCNNTQHIGLQDKVSDFRLCCRTFTVNPVVQFLYWHMNYHIEHHMYAAVPCYKLRRLHRAIQHDLPPCPRGLVATWKEIVAILKIQQTNPAYQYVAVCPQPCRKGVDRRAAVTLQPA